ncbi:uncharacterized protein LOC127248018 isoform X2 [Andrographis paniculata]|uniref:uncharacterized protein LOC127248018 isoform X2 n=1 Tax=Andrographis paniculata TaxID=175694 RepID=UPI0021E8B817|nr:uncharacterized protein LOC127248018 isoform X2 [Andrographis paniculata]
MAIIPQAASNIILSFKVMLISTTVLSAAIALNFSFPAITDFVVCELPSIYNAVVSWLRPPYLYLVLNCIIITIVASSKLQSHKIDDASVSPPPPMQPIPNLEAIPSQPDVVITQTNYPTADLNNRSGYLVEVENGADDFNSHEVVKASRSATIEQTAFSVVHAVDGDVALGEDASRNKEKEQAVIKCESSSNPSEIKISTESSSSIAKPPISARLAHRRNAKSSAEGGKAAALGVSKPKREDTLESTWKTITEGRPVPLNRHLRKSDTWEREAHRPSEKPAMGKSETFTERRRSKSPVRKEASLSQEELNRRVEAFINKFNEEMRLQRQESLDHYRDLTINRASISSDRQSTSLIHVRFWKNERAAWRLFRFILITDGTVV